MKKIFLKLNLMLLLLVFPLSAFAHETEMVHEEVPATVDPMVAIGVVVIVIIGGIIIWKVMFGKKQSPIAQTKEVPTETLKNVQQSSQPEKLETKK